MNRLRSSAFPLLAIASGPHHPPLSRLSSAYLVDLMAAFAPVVTASTKSSESASLKDSEVPCNEKYSTHSKVSSADTLCATRGGPSRALFKGSIGIIDAADGIVANSTALTASSLVDGPSSRCTRFCYRFVSVSNGNIPTRIDVAEWIVEDIRIAVEALHVLRRLDNDIRLEEATKRWVILTATHVDDAVDIFGGVTGIAEVHFRTLSLTAFSPWSLPQASKSCD